MVEAVAGTLLSAALQPAFDALVKYLKKSVTCREECKRLKLAIEKHRPKLIRLAKLLDERGQNGRPLVPVDEWCEEMRALLVHAEEIVHEFQSGKKLFHKVYVSPGLVARIEGLRTRIEEMHIPSTIFETLLALNPLHQSHCSAQQHCHCPAANTVRSCHCLRQTKYSHHGASMPHLRTVPSDPVSHHSASDLPGTSHIRHSRSEEVYSNVAHDSCHDPPVLGIDQWRNDVNRFNAAEQRTRADLDRRHSTIGIPHYPRSGASGYPVADTRRYSGPETSTHAPSAPPLPISTPSSPRHPSGKMFSYLGDGQLHRALQKGYTG